MPATAKRSKKETAALQQKLNDVWPKAGPFPWLRVLETAIAKSPKMDGPGRESFFDLFRFIREELKEGAVQTEGEAAFLRILRALPTDADRRVLFSLSCQAAGMGEKDADDFAGALNFGPWGTTAVGGVK